MELDADLIPFHRPERSLLLSGISRSGTSLLCALINELDNAVCLNEVLPTRADELPRALAKARRDLLRGRPVANKFDADGALTTNTLAEGVRRDKRVVDKPLDEQLLLASKRNIPYLLNLEPLLALDLTIVVLLRDPVYAIGSWGSPGAVAAGIPGARIGPADEHPHWAALELQRQDTIERRAEAWQACAERIWRCRAQLTVLRYEDLCADPRAALEPIATRFGLDLISPRLEARVLPAQNDDQRYPQIPRIREVVSERCPLRSAFGYR
jgi:hypothetical protein